MTIHFIGAGPGAPDLDHAARTRPHRALSGLPFCGLAGAARMLAYCPPDARIIDTAPMSLDEIVAEFVRRRRGGRGCRASAFRRSVDLERARRTIAAARCARHPLHGHAGRSRLCRGQRRRWRRELTLPEVAQSVVLTRTPGRRLGDARKRNSAHLRRDAHDAGDPSLHSCARQVVAELVPAYGADCPVADRLSRVLAGRADFARHARHHRRRGRRSAALERTALILVGRRWRRAISATARFTISDYQPPVPRTRLVASDAVMSAPGSSLRRRVRAAARRS